MEFDPDNIPAPLELHRETIRPEWIDYNGHMNVAYYVLVFDHNVDALFDYIGLDEAHRTAENVSTFALEMHVVYARELHEGDPVRIESLLLDCDDKRLHYIARMVHAEEGYLAATAEWISMHVDMSTRRSAPFRPPVRERLEAIKAAYADVERPPEVGRTIGIKRR